MRRLFPLIICAAQRTTFARCSYPNSRALKNRAHGKSVRTDNQRAQIISAHRKPVRSQNLCAPLGAILGLLFSVSAFATVTEQTDWQRFDCDAGTTGFAFTFKINAATDLEVILVDTSSTPYTSTVLTPTTHYSVSVTNNRYPASGGTVTTVATYPATYDLIITTDIALSQTASLAYNQWAPATVQAALDKLCLVDNEFNRKLTMAVRNPESLGPSASGVLPGYGSYGYLYRTSAGSFSLLTSVEAGITMDPNFWNTAIPSFAAIGDGDPCTVYRVSNDLYWEGPDSVAKYLSSLLNEDDMATSIAAGATADLIPPSQHSVYNYVKTGTVTMTNKTLTAPTANNATLNSPVLNTAITGTAIDTNDALLANSDTKIATQSAVKSYVDAQVATHGIFVSGATIFSSTLTASGTFQDLDVSAIVGTATAELYLQVTSDGVGHHTSKPKGYGGTYAQHTNNASDLADNGAGCGAAVFEAAGEFRYEKVVTNSSGVFQHAYSDNSDTVTIVLITYNK